MVWYNKSESTLKIERSCPMAAVESEQNDAQLTQAASIIGQLEILRTTCREGGNTIGDICCQIAIIALSMIITQRNPPKRWETAMKEESGSEKRIRA